MKLIGISIFMLIIAVSFLVIEIKRVQTNQIQISRSITISNIVILSIISILYTIVICEISMEYLFILFCRMITT